MGGPLVALDEEKEHEVVHVRTRRLCLLAASSLKDGNKTQSTRDGAHRAEQTEGSKQRGAQRKALPWLIPTQIQGIMNGEKTRRAVNPSTDGAHPVM